MSAACLPKANGSTVVLMAALCLASAQARGHVVLDAPNGGEVLTAGCAFTVTWHIQISHALLDWDLWYSTTGPNGPWIVVAEDLPAGSGAIGSVHTYDWAVPDAPAEQAWLRVKMDNSGTDYEDVSNSSFTMAPPRPGDSDADCNADLDDWVAFEACLTGPGTTSPDSGCTIFDFDDDVDLADFASFQAVFKGD